MPRKRYIWVILFVVLALLRINTLMGQDEISHYYKLLRLLWEQGWSEPGELITFSPHGYPLVALLFCRIVCCCSAVAIKLAGVLMWVGVLLLCARKSSILLLATLPLACQAAVTVEIDQTILPLACLLLVFAWQEVDSRPGMFAYSLAVAFSLWCRVTTPGLVMSVLLLFSLGKRRIFLRTLLCSLCGIALFFVTWWGYCAASGVDFAGPFAYLGASFAETTVGNRHNDLGRIAQSLAYLMFWGFNPFFALLFVLDGLRRIRTFVTIRKCSATDIHWLVAAAILVGYTFVGGSLFGFPKYQCAAFPFAALAVNEYFEQLKIDDWEDRYLAVLGVCVAVMYFLLSNDPIYALRVSVRDIVIRGGGCSLAFLAGAFLPWAVAMLGVIVAVKCSLKHSSLVRLLWVCAVAVNLAFALRQCFADYSTGYIYGDRGECVRLAEMLPRGQEKYYVPVEVVHCMGLLDNAGLRPQDAELANLLPALEADLPECFAYSTLISMGSYVRELESSEKLQGFLRKHYDKTQDDHLVIYWRKKQGAN